MAVPLHVNFSTQWLCLSMYPSPLNGWASPCVVLSMTVPLLVSLSSQWLFPLHISLSNVKHEFHWRALDFESQMRCAFLFLNWYTIVWLLYLCFQTSMNVQRQGSVASTPQLPVLTSKVHISARALTDTLAWTVVRVKITYAWLVNCIFRHVRKWRHNQVCSLKLARFIEKFLFNN